jgi:hypothetical protein
MSTTTNATGWMDHPNATKHIDHAAYPKLCRSRSDAELLYVIADCRATLEAWPDQPNHGYYADEINYCADELARRRRGGKRARPSVDDIAAAAARAAWALAEHLDG